MKRGFYLLALLFTLSSANKVSAQQATHRAKAKGGQDPAQAQFPSGEAYKKANITYSLTPTVNNTWGYVISVDNKPTIIQPAKPGMSGNEGFRTKAGAESVAKLVIQKMKKGEMPPTITIDEMKKLKAI